MYMPTQQPRRRRTGIGAFVVLIIGLALIAILFWQRQNLLDWWALRGYTPSSAITTLADETTLTPQARHVFYVNKPQVLGSSAFNSTCPNHGGEQTIILGCYHGNQHGIFLYNVTDERLNGVMQVTAAHELLHAEYDRLSGSERKKVDGQLQDFYAHHLTDERIKSTIEAYKQSEPDELVNEMHSIFGTEVRDLTPDLEAYYQRYFQDRSKVVGYAEAYQGEFTNRQQQVTAYDEQLAVMRPRITEQQQSLSTESTRLQQERSDIDAMNPADNRAAYNARVSDFNQHVASYNQAVSDLKALIAQYNDIVDKRNTIALETQELSEAIDSHYLESL